MENTEGENTKEVEDTPGGKVAMRKVSLQARPLPLGKTEGKRLETKRRAQRILKKLVTITSPQAGRHQKPGKTLISSGEWKSKWN